MQRMKQEKKINIFDLVKQLRFQRMKMVQTVDQYIFLYSSVLELVEARKQRPQGTKDFVQLSNCDDFIHLLQLSRTSLYT